MDASFSLRTGREYWMRRLWKNGTWTVLPIAVFGVLIPAWYTWKAQRLVGGEEKVNFEKTARRIDVGRQGAVWLSAVFLIFMALVIRVFDK